MTTPNEAIAAAHPNIAFIKYWGNREDALRLPMNGSISMNLATLETQTRVHFSAALPEDRVTVNGQTLTGDSRLRVTRFLDTLRRMADDRRYAEVTSESNFPIGAGIASSAAAFAALALAGSSALGLGLSEAELSRLARLGSGSASRSIPGGFCEWLAGDSDETSIAVSLAPASHWALTDIIAVVSREHKKVGSSAGHTSAATSPYQEVRVATAPERLLDCRNAILQRDFFKLAEVAERDSTMMHAVMMTQQPPLFYWSPVSLAILEQVRQWREVDALPCFATLDAGPNVHVLCLASAEKEIRARLADIAGVTQLLVSGVGGPARLLLQPTAAAPKNRT